MSRLLAASFAVALCSACAHKPQPQADEVTARPATPPAPAPQRQLDAQPSTADNGGSELAAALASTSLFFDFDSDQLKPEGLEALRRISKILRDHPTLAIKVEGHCDERGTEEYNLMLGQRRAEVARKYLVDLGVGGGQVETISFGDERPAVSGHSEEAWAKNRRDEVRATR